MMRSGVPPATTNLEEDVIFEDALYGLEQVGAERQSVLEGGLLATQRRSQLGVRHARGQRLHRPVVAHTTTLQNYLIHTGWAKNGATDSSP